MPQLAPVNWLLLFFLFWFAVGLVSTVIWWSFKTDYKIQGVSPSKILETSSTNQKAWNW
uniref:ATP synthase F0 subunit 8 n=1 Tax=Tegula lividomaculata TaxID=1764038 RepID=A0A0X9PX36_9VEST|nr:ATP synthase F0 subunit 8 [Tegula lividomaculata]AMA07346.1 ATP synthase F0 subunit 8 [Tegula lividomaculata]